MKHLGKFVAVVFAGSLALGTGIADAKTTKVTPKGTKTARQAKNTKKQAKQDEMLLPLVGKKSPFGNLAPVAKPVKTAKSKTKRVRASGLRGLNRRASMSFDLGRRSAKAIPSNDQTMLRMTAVKLKAKDISKVISKHMARIHVCYERAVSMNRAPKGTVSVKFVVEPNGSVSSAAVACGKKNHALRRCMERRIKSWKFPKADAPTTVDYPFVFDIAESKAGKSK